ncbi:MAG TPA: phenylalanine--tRNA ligase beta subunit-related protein [Desulfobacteraceae bacterium]|nr:phenylalanine--tRNA ligase beta subunit-related protein [Desulfobacteraceae bacterium]HPQ27920.1 phenylalanine--tRNA ligase beta subunit-related protein [Desulfobacteraceae bacterium]
MQKSDIDFEGIYMGSTELLYVIANDVFAQFPGYVRGVVIAHGVKNGDSPYELISMLRSAEVSVREQFKEETIVEDPRIVSWREAYRSFGAKPAKFRPSMEAMARRVLHNQEIPSINILVDIGNLVSLRHIIPVGGHAIDFVKEGLSLRAANGDEKFTPFGSDEIESPLPGEIIFAEGDKVLTRRWTWRQANHTLLVETTTAVEFNVDALPPVSIGEVEEICREISELVERFCGGHTRHEIMTEKNARIRIDEIK